MKWFKKQYEKIPRPVRTAIQMGLLPLVALVFYIVIRMPIYSGTMALRMAEKANMVGPGRILGILTDEFEENLSIVLAEDEKGYIFCRYYTDSPYNRPLLSYREKQGDLAVLAVPFYLVNPDRYHLPVVLICNDARASYAELDLTITVPYGDRELTYEYSLAGNREQDDYFEFCIDVAPNRWTEEEHCALETFASVSQTNFGITSRDCNAKATIRLYSREITRTPDGSVNYKDAELYRTEEITIQSIVDDAVERFGTP